MRQCVYDDRMLEDNGRGGRAGRGVDGGFCTGSHPHVLPPTLFPHPRPPPPFSRTLAPPTLSPPVTSIAALATRISRDATLPSWRLEVRLMHGRIASRASHAAVAVQEPARATDLRATRVCILFGLGHASKRLRLCGTRPFARNCRSICSNRRPQACHDQPHGHGAGRLVVALMRAQERDPLVVRQLARRRAGNEEGTGITVRYQGTGEILAR
jgi:hypothetical protein